MADYYVDGTIVSASGTGSGAEADPWGKTDDLIHYAITQIEAGAGKGTRGDTIYIIAGDVNSTQSPWIQQTTTTNFYNSDRPLIIIGKGRDRTAWDGGGNPKIGWDYNEGNPRLDYLVLANMTLTNLPTTSGTANHLWGGSTLLLFMNCDLIWDSTGNGQFTNINRAFSLVNCRAMSLPSQNMAYSGGARHVGTYFDCRAVTGLIFYGGHYQDCFFDVKDAGRTSFAIGMINVSPSFYNCTFDLRGNTAAVVTRLDGWEYAQFYNNYVEGDGANTATLASLYLPGATPLMVGNTYYNAADLTTNQSTDLNRGYHDNGTFLTSSGLKDLANGDARPADNLIAAAQFNVGMRDDYISQRRTPGCFTAQNLIGKPYHPRVRG